MTDAKYSYDSECYGLAQYFLFDEPALRPKAEDLAQAIQQAVEDWFASERLDDEIRHENDLAQQGKDACHD